MYSSFLYSIYIFILSIYILVLYIPCPYSYFSSFISLPFQGLFYFSGSLYSPHQKKISQKKKLVRKKIFLFLRKKFLLFLEVPSEKKLFFYIGKIFFPPYILLRSIKAIMVGISELRQNKLVRREYIYSAWGTRGQRIWGVQEVWNVQINWGVQRI